MGPAGTGWVLWSRDSSTPAILPLSGAAYR
jgi:hypothetical protein